MNQWGSLIIVVVIWELVSFFGLVPKFLLPSFTHVLTVLFQEGNILAMHVLTTLVEALIGLSFSVFLAGILAVLMDKYHCVHTFMMPLLLVSQTIPTVALAPLLILWFGYGMMPKIILIVIVCFFPLTMSLLNGFKQIDEAYLNMMNSFHASYWQIMKYVKFPFALPSFFSGLKVSTSYAIISAVIAEWLGGDSGLGVYMTRVRKSYAFDKMFAVIILISLFSLILLWGVNRIERFVLQK
ncbi:ABC transporter permease [Granulicatella sp. 19428wC4_WM01]|nr:ABC transporter permease [Granulicatella sp. 19428wC4_WM01]TFU95900.1 ABC transporter permease [Granulicatella sp. WM01]